MSFANFKNSKNLLNAEQMKRVSGGGSCGVMVELRISEEDGRTFTYIRCGISKEDALSFRGTGSNFHWCCDSCGISSYCG